MLWLRLSNMESGQIYIRRGLYVNLIGHSVHRRSAALSNIFSELTYIIAAPRAINQRLIECKKAPKRD